MIKLKPITPKRKISAESATRSLVRGMQQVTRNVRGDFESTTVTFQHENVVFNSRTTVGTDKITSSVSTSNLIYKFIVGGTKVRYATMTKDFVAKTMPNVIGSQAGQGGLLYVNPKIDRGPIEARNFDIEIGKKTEKEMPNVLAPFVERAAYYLYLL